MTNFSLQTGRPTIEGYYTCATGFGWKTLEWYQGAWHHHRNTAAWMPADPVHWIGPLPDVDTLAAPAKEFDL